jgi:hypothetical protein
MTHEKGLPVARACSATRLPRAAYYRPVTDSTARDAEIINALNAIVAVELR